MLSCQMGLYASQATTATVSYCWPEKAVTRTRMMLSQLPTAVL